jgi:hypothetical protein
VGLLAVLPPWRHAAPRGGVNLIFVTKFLEMVELPLRIMMILFQFLPFRSEIHVLIRLGRFSRRVGVDVVDNFLCELFLDTTNERSEFR